MKRIWTYILLCLLAAGSCTRVPEEELPVEGASYPEGAKVTIHFTVAAEGSAATKTQQLGEDQPLESLHLAVFGSSGYLKEYVEATLGGQVGTTTFTDPATLDSDEPKTTTVSLYEYSAKLTLTDSKRIIHFIGNGPSNLSFGYADAVLSSLLSTKGERAYWQMMRIDGIKAKTSTTAYEDDNGVMVEVGDYIDALGNKITNGQGYVVADVTRNQFKEIPLVRNWAKIVVEADTHEGNNPHFTPISYAVVHVPDRGTLAPHSSATRGFIEDYQKKTYWDIVNMGYPANLPPNATMDNSLPDITDFKRWDPQASNYENPNTLNGAGGKNGVAPAGEHGAVYLYERPVPTEQLEPTFIIVYGQFDDPEKGQPGHTDHSGKYFYKIDLMTDGQYYPVYRNFQYRILIHSIIAPGHTTPIAAASAAGSADVSADINARHLPDISDGQRRLAVSWMAKTYTDAQVDNTELSVYFASSPDGPNLDAGTVTLEPLPMKQGVDPVITHYSIDAPNASDPSDPSYGWRTIHFSTSGPSNTIRSQTLRVRGSSDGESLYRDIIITIQEIQELKVECSDVRIKAEKGTPVDVYISIPDGLVQSMFPLSFLIEPTAMTLSPDNDNLPVEYGPSISGNGKSSFHFIKALDWDEYHALPTELDASDKLWRRMTCHFLSNRDLSTTDILVRNDTYFYPSSTHLGTFMDKSFHDLGFLEPILKQSAQELTLTFDVDRDPDWPQITLSFDGIRPQARDGLSLPAGFTQVGDAEYRFTPAAAQVTIPVITTDATGEVYARVSAEDYYPQSVRTHHFTLFNGVGFLDGHGSSKVVFGKVNRDNNNIIDFGYFDDPEALNPTITLRDRQSLNMLSPSSYPWTPDGPKSSDGANNYHELQFKTNNNDLQKHASFILSAPGYIEEKVDAERIRGNIYTYTNNSLKASGMTGHVLTASMSTTSGVEHSSIITFSEAFRIEGNGVWLDAGQTGTITLSVETATEYTFYPYYVQFNIGSSTSYGGWKRLFPDMDSVVVPDDEVFIKYPGANDHCVWIRPDKSGDATVTLSANENYPVQITGLIIKTFRYN